MDCQTWGIEGVGEFDVFELIKVGSTRGKVAEGVSCVLIGNSDSLVWDGSSC